VWPFRHCHYPGGASEEIGGVDPFNVKNFKERAVDAEDGVATIDWVVLLAALTRSVWRWWM
jgi:hypothetical protein